MPFYTYVHGARGAVTATVKRVDENDQDPVHNKRLALVPIAAGVAWDEGFDYVPIHEGFRELYAQVAGTRLGSWTIRGIVLALPSDATDFVDVFKATNALVADSLIQPNTGSYLYTYPRAVLDITLFDGVNVVNFTGVVLTATLIAPIEGVLTMEFSGLTLSEISIYTAAAYNNQEFAKVLVNTRKTFIRSAEGQIMLHTNPATTPIHALSFDVTVAREAQVIYSYGNPASDVLVHNEEKAYGDIYGSRRFTTPLVVSQGISSVGCTMLLEGKILKRATANTPSDAVFVEHTQATGGKLFPPGNNSITIREGVDLSVAWTNPANVNQTHKVTIHNIIMTGKRVFQLSRPRPIYMFTVRPAARIPQQEGDTILTKLATFDTV